jgi:hypothetical protein
MQLFHMIRGSNLPGVPGGIHEITPRMVEALDGVPWLPWLNWRHCVQGDGTTADPFRVNLERMERKVDEYLFDDDLVELRQPWAYLDIEPPMNQQLDAYPGRGEIYRDAIYAALHFVTRRTWAQLQLGIYAVLTGRFRRGQPPAHFWHAHIDPFVGLLCLSFYNWTRPIHGDLEGAVAKDAQIARNLLDYYLRNRNGRPIMAFVWGWSKGGFTVPFDLWTDYVEGIIQQLDYDLDAICWFGKGNSYFDADFAQKIEWLRKRTSISAGIDE